MPASNLFARLCRSFALPQPQLEYQFHPNRKWRIDYYFEANGVKVGLEVEGGVWTGGRHTRPKGFLGDMEKYNAMACAGIFLLRVTPDDLLKTKTFTMLKSILYEQ